MENNFQRLKRDRDFQTRVLIAIEKPKPTALASVARHPLFLWLLSAVFLTLGGGYITKRQECLADSRVVMQQFEDLSLELDNRRDTLLKLLKESSNLEQFQEQAKRIPSTLEAHSNLSLSEIARRRTTLESKIDFGAKPPTSLDFKNRIQKMAKEAQPINWFAEQELYLALQEIMMGMDAGLTADEYSFIKKTDISWLRLLWLQNLVSGDHYVSNCSVGQLIRQLISDTIPKVVKRLP